MKRFNSKIDMWILVVLVSVLVIQSFVFFSMMFGNVPMSARYAMIASTLLVFTLIGSILMRTHYTVADGVLKIVCGPITRSIKIADITSVTETRNPLSSPALSLDRLRIQYGRRSIMISPDDKRGFLKAIGQELA